MFCRALEGSLDPEQRCILWSLNLSAVLNPEPLSTDVSLVTGCWDYATSPYGARLSSGAQHSMCRCVELRQMTKAFATVRAHQLAARADAQFEAEKLLMALRARRVSPENTVEKSRANEVAHAVERCLREGVPQSVVTDLLEQSGVGMEYIMELIEEVGAMAQQSVEDSVDAATVQHKGDEVSDMAHQSVEDSVDAAAVQPQGDEVSDVAHQSVEDSVDAAAVQPQGDELSDVAHQSVEDSVDAATVDLDGEEVPGKQGIELSTPEQSLAGDDMSVQTAEEPRAELSSPEQSRAAVQVESVKMKVESLKQKGNDIVKTDPAGAIKWSLTSQLPKSTPWLYAALCLA